ncbi:MAG TPA: PEGA domain-containing protein [Polyangiaceae bacterium]|nr:PEGA domain-containing protein [Polyangiaceae bacterium]
MTHTRALAALLVALSISATTSRLAWAQTKPAPTDAQKEEARSHFELGLSHFDREEWQAALVEFLKSRELFPTRGNTKDAAICLRRVGRFDEALDMYEALLRDFPDLAPADRALAQREIGELQASVGTIAIDGAPDGASVTIDGIDRGKTPIKPLRLSAGTHSIRVTKEDTLPFEARVDLVGRQAATVHAQLAALTQAGRLRVAEHAGKSLEIVVDGAVVGRTPWEGALAPGPHTVLLKGEGNLGTPPKLTEVKLEQLTSLDLTAEQLGAELRVDPKPSSAAVTIDGVPVGRGVWDGRLRPGAHRVEASAEGYAPLARDVTIGDGAKEVVAASLEPLAAPGGRGSIALEIDLGLALGLLNGSDLASSCTSGCSSSLPLGFEGQLHGTYQFAVGLGLGLHAGYLLLGSSIDDRTTTITSPGARISHSTTTHDGLLMGGLVAGIDGQYRTRGDWPLTLRLGFGVFIGSVRDHRTGSFTDSKGGAFALDTSQSPTAAYLDIAPEVRFGRRFGQHVELNVGVAGHILAAVSVPRWDATKTVLTGADGEGNFTGDSVAGSVVIALVPSLGLKYEF